MKINVQGITIDTTEISDIVDIEFYKKAFFNREAGFIIELIDKQPIKFGENIPYESYPYQISEAKNKWKRLEDEIRVKWQKDKTDLQVFKIQ